MYVIYEETVFKRFLFLFGWWVSNWMKYSIYVYFFARLYNLRNISVVVFVLVLFGKFGVKWQNVLFIIIIRQ